MTDRRELLRVDDLRVYYPHRQGGILGRQGVVRAVDGVSFSAYEGETLGLVGESGCGKTTTGRALVQQVKPTGGTITINGHALEGRHRRERMARAKEIQMIFQDSASAFDPRLSIGKAIEEPLVVHKIGTAEERRQRVLGLMADVGLHPEMLIRFPHEFSGGQRQRISVARALALSPQIVVCDEPVSALDVSIQAQILNLMMELQQRYRLTYVFISHNLGVVRHICNRVAVMYLGHIVELADASALFAAPAHPYTQALMSAIPQPDPAARALGEPLPGDVPSPMNPPPGCVFGPRCARHTPRCDEGMPPLREIDPGHTVACWEA